MAKLRLHFLCLFVAAFFSVALKNLAYSYFDATVSGYVIAARSALPYRCHRESELTPESLCDNSSVMMGIPRVRPA